MYYTDSNAKTELESWYQTNITDKGYASKVVSGDYFWEQAKVKVLANRTSGNATMAVYLSHTPSFKCTTDGNRKGLVNVSYL